MSTNRRWTVLVVPHGSASPRSIAVSERALRTVAGSVAGVLGLVVLMGAGFAISYTGRALPTAPVSATAPSAPDLDRRLGELRDTLRVLQKREQQIRLLAGLPAMGDSTASLSGDHRSEMDRAAAASSPVLVEALIHRANLLASRFATVSDSLSRNVQRLASLPSIMPTAGWLTSNYSRRRFHPILHVGRAHEGIDVAAPMGAPIIAPAAGVVTRVGRESGYGLSFEIDHGNGIVTRYAHCSRVSVRGGQRVTRGQLVGAVGSSGLATGPHLHYEIRVNGRVVDPLTFVLPGTAIPD